MFDFFKKNKLEKTEQIEKEIVENEKESMAIHVMPERFRNQTVKQHGAKTAGLAIIIGGIVVLLIVSAVLYYFLFVKTNTAVVKEQNSPVENGIEKQPEKTVEIPENPVATGTGQMTLPSEDETVPADEATTTPEADLGETELALKIGIDGDNDGLTDTEEIILGSDAFVPDTDGDGYLDGPELINLYNPAGTGKLAENPHVSVYENKTFSYSLLYPSAWQMSVNGGDDSLMFKTGDNQFIQIIVQPNVNKQNLNEWYMEQVGVAQIEESYIMSGDGLAGIKSPDGLNIYLMDGRQNYIFSLTYNLGGGTVLEYSDIFQMMVKSFNLKN
ncbi:MAG: hypothetical protein V1667_02235 [bacterium]